MKNQTTLDTEKDYRKHKAINYSLLSQFNIHPDNALIHRDYGSPAMELGKIFECYLEKIVTGNKDNSFDSYYKIVEPSFINDYAEILNKKEQSIPTNIVRKIEENYQFTNSDIMVTAKGEWNKTKFRDNFYIQHLIEYPNVYPVMPSIMENIETMVANMLKLEFKGIAIKDILKNAIFQFKYVWNEEINTKKAMFDAVANIEVEGYDLGIVGFDFKTSFEKRKFLSMFNQKYWIQDRHYQNGLNNLNKNAGSEFVYDRIVFLTVLSTPPFTAFVSHLKDSSLEGRNHDYQNLITDFTNWDKNGRKYIGTDELIELY